VRVGADIERVERRSRQFVEDYFTSAERDEVENARPAARDRTVTLFWSAKEAALKALRLGLTVDTRRVSCALRPARGADQPWARLSLALDQELSREYGLSRLDGWWRLMDSYVLTLVVMHRSA
jgi:4'-phosphopantetheinyl transferase